MNKLKLLLHDRRLRAAFIVAAVGGVLQFLGLLHDLTGKSALTASNQKYIDESLAEVASEAVFFEASQTGLDLIKSSTTGVSLGLELEFQIGQLVGFAERTVRDLNSVIKLSAVTLASLWGVESAAHAIAEPLLWVLWAGLLAYAFTGVSLKLAAANRQIVRVIQMATVLVLFLYAVIPLSILASSALSKHLLSAQRSESHAYFHSAFGPLNPPAYQAPDSVGSNYAS